MLVLRHGDDVLLEKRASTGVWAALWSLPELAHDEDPCEAGARRYGCQLGSIERLATLRHGFTHFNLEITPLVANVRRAVARAAEPGALWLPISDALGAALPVPVRKLLCAISRSAASDQPELFDAAEG